MTKSLVYFLRAQTDSLVGSDKNIRESIVDTEIQRMPGKHFPYIRESSFKGAIRWHFENNITDESKGDTVTQMFGGDGDSQPASVGVSSAKPLLIPFRSSTGQFVYATCPYLLELFNSVMHQCGQSVSLSIIGDELEANLMVCFGGAENRYIEDILFTSQGINTGDLPAELAEKINISEDNLKRQLVVLSNDDFSYMALKRMPIVARNKIADEDQDNSNLWYEERLPTETVLYTHFNAANHQQTIKTILTENPYIQVGSNASNGLGYFELNLLEVTDEGEVGV